jgi:hypothetical protein
VRAIGAQRWEFTAKYTPMTRADFMPVYAFIISQQGQLGTFSIVPPVISSTRGTASGTMLANGAHSIGDTTIAVDGFTGIIRAGDFIKFGTHSKVYMVTADLNGAGTLNIEPGLVASIADNAQVVYNSVTFTMRISNDVQEFGLSGYEKYGYEIDMVEVL